MEKKIQIIVHAINRFAERYQIHDMKELIEKIYETLKSGNVRRHKHSFYVSNDGFGFVLQKHHKEKGTYIMTTAVFPALFKIQIMAKHCDINLSNCTLSLPPQFRNLVK